MSDTERPSVSNTAAPSPYQRTWFNGRLNLEQQKKRARELLRAYHQDQAPAVQRFQQHHPRYDHGFYPQLADAQWVIARENGFASWARMKTHIEQLAHQPDTAPDGRHTLHLRCGEDIRQSLQLAGFIGDFQQFADPFCQGPLADLPLPEFIHNRARFIASAYELEPADALARLQGEYAVLQRLEDYQQVVLWFEHDSYDQLILAFLLDQLLRLQPKVQLELICVEQVPGVPDFIGLGQLTPELLTWLWHNQRVPLGRAHLQLGRQVWRALCQPDPAALQALAAAETPPILPMQRALQRHLRELPSSFNGLGLTQHLALQAMADYGADTVGRVFAVLMRQLEPLPFLGDLMFWHLLRQLQQSREPLFVLEPGKGDPGRGWPSYPIFLTETGVAVLRGKRDFRELFYGERWVGGICIKGQVR
ncbi:hypothetical protein C4K68_21165 [Pokkaliibacter plantistimulans]|uniref:DUF1835 domain-containing protein n=1 Tax=Proteobacteria bacterium 228 TaxID=2083153 RepID=A0A2S5KJY0_9PROT|nr:DUF1835 domain-containing protein [Pokkaliibacter plantistimulans]PPC75154.1 hypothetical protein C4K68_21165 [Pokkaliibacter plantistimulans]